MRRLALILLLVLAWVGFTARPGERTLHPARPGEPTVTVFLVDNGYHTDIALPGAALTRTGGVTARAARRLDSRAWVLAGWGDERFYAETGMSGHRALDGLRALFAPRNPSVVHLSGLSESPEVVFADEAVTKIVLSRAGFERMVQRIDRSFAGDGETPIRRPVKRGADEAFFQSVESFSLIHLCNHWTAQVLNEAGLGVTPVLDTFPFGLKLDLTARARLRGQPLDTVPAGA